MAGQEPSGRFITFEGGEGSGKSTQLRRLVDRLTEAGIDVVATREPGGTPGADAIRALLVEGAADRWDAVTEALLHFAARRDHLEAVIRPALARGHWVVCDRFTDSTMAYQGYGHQLGVPFVDALDRLVTGGAKPDLTFILDIDPEAGLGRAAGRAGDETRYESFDKAFHERVREGFRTIAAGDPARCALIPAGDTQDRVGAAVWQALQDRIGAPAA